MKSTRRRQRQRSEFQEREEKTVDDSERLK